MKAKMILATLLVALTTMGFDCVNNDFLVSVNVNGVSGTFQVNRGNGNFDGSKTILASDYLNPDFSDEIKDVRIYDVQVSSIGPYAGSVVNGTVSVNGQAILTLVASTPWSAFNTPQSLLTSPFIHRVPGGIAVLVNAIRNKQNIILRGFGDLSAPVNQDDMFVKVEVFGQVDASVK
jgi:hypothetical protein